MSKNELTAAQLADRWMDQREIQNLMGKFVQYELLKKEKGIFSDFWCAEADEPTLGINNGYYVGYQAIRAYYDARFDITEVKSKHMQKMFPDFLGPVSDIELHGVGSCNVNALTSPIVEVAEDGRTAKGLWSVMGIENEIFEIGPCTMLAFGYIAADFVKENGDWKIWHLLKINDIYAPGGQDWAGECVMPEAVPEFAELAALRLPEPTVAVTIREPYHPSRKNSPLVKVPKPYSTFSETFSYGIQ